ncbi:alcohol dehydrogenase catalytic domain-containing protein [Streptomyces sp. TP-A0356]|uniref:alcohol dehydrogenase catalytic domain-containing protein n=1 Tax=Streptomyces sp. TP-A0356 TaxID=1359208 RepID=UPI0006E1DF8A|nr:alcohol dehydrogenase catalytic domain-containing protein [Streptomyces sp. TP-A0356]
MASNPPAPPFTLLGLGLSGGDLRQAAALLLGGPPGDEMAVRGADHRVARLVPASLTDTERLTATALTVRYGEDRFRLRAARAGDLGSLRLVVTQRRAPGPAEVELQVGAAGVNFRDVLTVMGLLPAADRSAGGGDRIGFECTGTVTAVGPGVEHVRVGDTVLAVDLAGGAFGSFTTVRADAVVPVCPPASTPLPRRPSRRRTSPPGTRCGTWRASPRANAY